jgi:sulfur relay (sulfurtransferase) DsrC/TusE family protein
MLEECDEATANQVADREDLSLEDHHWELIRTL